MHNRCSKAACCSPAPANFDSRLLQMRLVPSLSLMLQGHGVTIIHESPKWGDRMKAMLSASQDSNIAHSHLYANADMQIGTWQRIDIPVLPVLSQYEYVLFSDADVFFRRPVTLDAFTLPLPDTIGMASEAADVFPYNAGIMLMHLPALRSSYERFLDFIFSNKHGLFFPGNACAV